MRFDCAGASGSRVRPSRKSQKNTETAACKPTRFRMTFFSEKVLKMTSKGRLGDCRKAWKMRSKVDAASRSLFFRKRVPKGSPGGTQLNSFWCLLVALGLFWGHFGVIFHVFSKMFGDVSDLCWKVLWCCLLLLTWIIPGVFLACSWSVPGLFLDCFWIVPWLFLDCSWIVLGLFLDCS